MKIKKLKGKCLERIAEVFGIKRRFRGLEPDVVLNKRLSIKIKSLCRKIERKAELENAD